MYEKIYIDWLRLYILKNRDYYIPHHDSDLTILPDLTEWSDYMYVSLAGGTF